MAEATPPPTVRQLRWGNLVPLGLVWVAVAVPIVLWLVHRADPELAVQVKLIALTWLLRALLVAAVLAAVACLAFPPAPAALRLAFARARLLLTSDRAPLTRALTELQHFESAARHLEVGRLALQLDETERAAKHLQRALELDGTVAAAHHQFGLVLLRAGHFEAALARFLDADRIEPGHAFGDALLFAGRTLFLLHRHEDGARLLRDHEARHGGGRRSHLWLGDALAAAGQTAAARAAWTAAAAPVTAALTAQENWCRALARVRLWRRGAS